MLPRERLPELSRWRYLTPVSRRTPCRTGRRCPSAPPPDPRTSRRWGGTCSATSASSTRRRSRSPTATARGLPRTVAYGETVRPRRARPARGARARRHHGAARGAGAHLLVHGCGAPRGRPGGRRTRRGPAGTPADRRGGRRAAPGAPAGGAGRTGPGRGVQRRCRPHRAGGRRAGRAALVPGAPRREPLGYREAPRLGEDIAGLDRARDARGAPRPGHPHLRASARESAYSRCSRRGWTPGRSPRGWPSPSTRRPTTWRRCWPRPARAPARSSSPASSVPAEYAGSRAPVSSR